MPSHQARLNFLVCGLSGGGWQVPRICTCVERVTCGGGRHSPRAGSHVTHVDLSSYQVLCGSELHVGGCSAGGNLLGPGHMSHMWTRLVLIINPVWLQLMRNVHHTLGKTSSSSDLCGHHVSHFFKKTFLLIGILLNRLHRSDPPHV